MQYSYGMDDSGTPLYLAVAQDMAEVKNDGENVKDAAYASLIDQSKEERQSGNRSIAGFVLLGAAVLGTGAFMRSKGIV